MSGEDSRFKSFSVDPRFRSVPKKQKKVKIDPRFKDVFKEKFAGPSVSIDKRGRSKKARGDTGEDLKRFYRSSEESDSNEDSDSEEEVEETVFDKWGELDADAERTDDETTRRLAICNMDWDRIGAKDLFLALSSFLPSSGSLLKVKLYLSDFGAERSKMDDVMGPEELRANRNKELTEEQMNERVRQYQVNRLKYYYAVAEFDSPDSASRVYEECDGMEFELSACRFDLRFIPDDVEFNEREPKEICDSLPEDEKYEAKEFETTALQKGKVDLTWDETDPKRTALMQKAFQNDEDDEALQAFINNSDDDEENICEEELDHSDEEDVVEKYRALLADVQEANEKKEEEKGGNMQITWNPDAEKKSKSSKNKGDLTPWEQYLEKRKMKQQGKREARRQSNKGETEQAFSDDEVPDGFDDPFFNTDPSQNDSRQKSNKSKKKKIPYETEEVNPDLNLLVMDEDEKNHFDYKEIEENGSVQADNFTLDLKDPRFQAIFDDPDYNVDPSHPNFKKTKSMKEIISEKQKRILELDEDSQPVPKRKAQVSEIDKLVKSVKMNARMKRKKMTKNKCIIML
ncbi:unnamed protein product [Lepeophtheirus salmonis]|uniref:(salmon louse) hypothetical protein n=1 Tax=Lepeophtheirus salmonis TaxID=72036 RepID=A0A7R8CUT3_LEPSM|nr:unnamed protein product [Lepeophtheirus salmonis]CAF2939265.1 unnamed protein product [Lepeophtheirus salmonis]